MDAAEIKKGKIGGANENDKIRKSQWTKRRGHLERGGLDGKQQIHK